MSSKRGVALLLWEPQNQTNENWVSRCRNFILPVPHRSTPVVPDWVHHSHRATAVDLAVSHATICIVYRLVSTHVKLFDQNPSYCRTPVFQRIIPVLCPHWNFDLRSAITAKGPANQNPNTSSSMFYLFSTQIRTPLTDYSGSVADNYSATLPLIALFCNGLCLYTFVQEQFHRAKSFRNISNYSMFLRRSSSSTRTFSLVFRSKL